MKDGIINDNFYLKSGNYNKGMFDLAKIRLLQVGAESISFKDETYTKESFLKAWENDERLINYLERLKHREANGITVKCEGCGKTQLVSKRKAEKYDFYTCSSGFCKNNPDFKLPKVKEGYIMLITPCAAGTFTGITNKIATEEELESLERAKSLLNIAVHLERLKYADEVIKNI